MRVTDFLELLKYEVCENHFSGEVGGRAVELPCKHIFYLACVNQLDPKKCPNCRHDFHVEPDSLPTPPALYSLLEHVDEEDKRSKLRAFLEDQQAANALHENTAMLNSICETTEDYKRCKAEEIEAWFNDVSSALERQKKKLCEDLTSPIEETAAKLKEALMEQQKGWLAQVALAKELLEADGDQLKSMTDVCLAIALDKKKTINTTSSQVQELSSALQATLDMKPTLPSIDALCTWIEKEFNTPLPGEDLDSDDDSEGYGRLRRISITF